MRASMWHSHQPQRASYQLFIPLAFSATRRRAMGERQERGGNVRGENGAKFQTRRASCFVAVHLDFC